MKAVGTLSVVGVLAALLLGVTSLSQAQQRGSDRDRPRAVDRGPSRVVRDGQGRWLDNRYDHGRYYPPRGATVRVLPPGYRPYYHNGARYYFDGGVWYRPGLSGAFIVASPPVGLFLSVLPPYYTRVWFGGVPYYYADDTYYLWRPDMNGYVVAAAPGPDTAAATTAPASASAVTEDFYIYPKNGQTAEQQAADRYECHSWAKGQTGFDPTEAGGGVPASQSVARRADYRRAMGACLEARGYSIK